MSISTCALREEGDFQSAGLGLGAGVISIHTLREEGDELQIAVRPSCSNFYPRPPRGGRRLMDYCFYELKKNIVVVFHATEEKDGDNTRLRIKVEGQTKNNVWEPMDLGGFVEMYGNDRTIGFSNCEKYFAKGTRGIHGVYKIPALGPGSPNDFLTKLFEEYNSKAAEEVAANAKENEAYEQVMQEGSKIIAGIKDADTANAAMPPFKALQHHLTSRQELNAQWKAKIAALGLTFDTAAAQYKPAEEAQ